MGRLMGKRRCRELLLTLGLLCAAVCLVAWPREAMAATGDGLKLCGNVILPSLFPFFVLSSLVVELGLSRYLGRLFQPVMAPLFRVNGACASAVALGFVGGYPVGARTAIQLYQSGQCSRTEAERLLAFCNNSGPAFILGVVGAGVFGSGSAGLLLYGVHVAASLLVGGLFRFYRPREGPRSGRLQGAQFQAVSFPAAFTRSVTGAMASTLNICAFVLVFTVVIRISGVSSLTDGSLPGRLSLAAFRLGWAGLSVHCQVLAFLGDSGLSMRTYLTGKLLHGGLSAALLGVLSPLLPLSAPVSAYLAEQTEALAALDFQRSLSISTAAAWGTWLLFFLLAARAVKNSGGKSRLHGV